MTIGTNDATTMTAMIRTRYWSTFRMLDPSAYPASVRPTDQISPPITCQIVNMRAETSSAPIIGFSTVRTIGRTGPRQWPFGIHIVPEDAGNAALRRAGTCCGCG